MDVKQLLKERPFIDSLSNSLKQPRSETQTSEPPFHSAGAIEVHFDCTSCFRFDFVIIWIQWSGKINNIS